MLKDLRPIADKISKPIANPKSLNDIRIPEEIVRGLSRRLKDFHCDRYSASYCTQANIYSILPSQFFKFACEFREVSKEIILYFKKISEVNVTLEKNGENAAVFLFCQPVDIKKPINANPKVLSLFENDIEIDLFANFLDNDKKSHTYRLGGKLVVNSDKGVCSLRKEDDVFSSIILNNIELPAVHSTGFGLLVYALANEDEIFDLLVEHFKKIPVPAFVAIAAGNEVVLPKPFLLLAGISGTGKSRFIRAQVERIAKPDLCAVIPVRPDWHEPSDLLGYVSRIPDTKYIPTAFLVFLANAWKAAFDSAIGSELTLKPLNQIPTFWVCLDEMNLAPVEQYFADYLSVIETRKWNGDNYSCAPLLRPKELLMGEKPEVLASMKSSLGLDGFDNLWTFFLEAGIPLPPNLVVAGTVNMDETTHGFSRKVIDRALTFDFGNFFPNDLDKYFGSQNQPKSLAFSRYSNATQADLNAWVPADRNGTKSTVFLKDINAILKDTPFELAYRALNELLVSLLCFKPKDDSELLAVWDDFLMCKLLPRLEGDEDKFRKNGTDVLDELLKLVQSKFPDEPGNTTPRPDLLNTTHDGEKLLIAYRSPAKLQWMKNRLSGGFTSFWP